MSNYEDKIKEVASWACGHVITDIVEGPKTKEYVTKCLYDSEGNHRVSIEEYKNNPTENNVWLFFTPTLEIPQSLSKNGRIKEDVLFNLYKLATDRS